MAKSKLRQKGHSGKAKSTSVSDAGGATLKYDPALVSLFSQSSGAVRVAARSGLPVKSHPTTKNAAEADSFPSDAEREEGGLPSEISLDHMHINLLNVEGPKAFILGHRTAKSDSRNRKRREGEDDLESRYMSQLARIEAKEDQSRFGTLPNKRQKLETHRGSSAEANSPETGGESTSYPDIITSGEEESAQRDIPQHESMGMSRAGLDLEKSSRTVFLANVSTEAIKCKKAKKTLMDHLTSFTPSLPANHGRHDIESIRFRSTAFAASGIPKKAAFARKHIMDTTTKSTNAYVVYTTQLAARKAVASLNGSIVLDRHLRVDSVAHPAKIDNRRCVFVGNLGFVDDETSFKSAQNEEIDKRPRRGKGPADIEEGLWRQFEKSGIVESVRVVRDQTTRVGKGFAYVQFKDANSVEKALLCHQNKFPPMLPRSLRVTRAKHTANAADRKEGPFLRNAESTKYRSKVPSEIRSLTGRAHKLLGGAGAAKLRVIGGQQESPVKSGSDVAVSPKSVVFEGFRASSSHGKGTIRMPRRKHNRPSNRSRNFRTQGRKKIKLLV